MRSAALTWRHVHWQRPVDVERALAPLREWAADQRSHRLVLEARSTGEGVVYLLGGAAAALPYAARTLTQAVPGTTVIPFEARREPVTAVLRLKASTRHRALRSETPEAVTRAVLGALSSAHGDEQLVVQLVLGPRRVPLAVPTNSPSSIVAPWWQVALHGNGQQVDSEKRTALRNKVSDHGYACTVRLGVRAATTARRQSLLLGLLAAIRTGEAAGLRLRAVSENARHLNAARAPWRWPLRLNVRELLCLTAWPLGDDELPGQPALHPKRLPPADGTKVRLSDASRGQPPRLVAVSTLPGVDAGLVLRPTDALHHLHVVGPTGTGKSTLLGNLISQDVTAGRAVVVIEPKGDLVADVLARIPDARRDDVVVLDASDSHPVGLNPLATHGRRPEVVADGLLAVFKQLYGEAIGPRSTDILHASLLTLARRPDAALVMLPLLLTHPGFRRSLTTGLHDPIALEPFWAQYEAWSEGERAAAIAPVMNKLRPLLRPSLRAVIGQRQPRFWLRQVFTERKVMLVPLRRGVLGPDAASLLGSLVVAELWQTIQERAAVPQAKRYPVMVYIDEVQDYLHLPTDLADGLAQARGLGVGFTLAHQYLAQLPIAMRTAVLANARSRVVFQTSPGDAMELAKGHPEVDSQDFTALDQYEVYASLFAGGRVTPYASARAMAPSAATCDTERLRQASRERYGRALDEVEGGFADLLNAPASEPTAAGRRTRGPA
jgi:hypothetical protein